MRRLRPTGFLRDFLRLATAALRPRRIAAKALFCPAESRLFLDGLRLRLFFRHPFRAASLRDFFVLRILELLLVVGRCPDGFMIRIILDIIKTFLPN